MLGRQSLEELCEAELRQGVLDMVTGDGARKVRLDAP
jgi:hypothetical protein